MKHNSPSLIRGGLLAGLLALLGVLGTACFPSHDQSTFDAAGPVAQSQLNLFLVIFWAAVFVFVVVEGMLIYAAIRFRRKPGQELPRQFHGNTKLEVAWTIAPALVLVVIAVPTVVTIFDTANTPKQAEVLRVNVRAHQWWWEFKYPELGIVTANELHVPPAPWVIETTLESDDVIHSFWIPKLVGKADVVPSNVNKLWFKASRADANPATPELDSYFGQCAEFCGTAHAQMRFRVVVEPTQMAFDEWVARQKAPAARPIDRLFVTKGCVVCHTVTGQDLEGTQKGRMDAFLQRKPDAISPYPAPNLTHFASRATFAGGILANNEENLIQWLSTPNKVKPGNRMAQLAEAYVNPEKALTDDEISTLVAYLQSLK